MPDAARCVANPLYLLKRNANCFAEIEAIMWRRIRTGVPGTPLPQGETVLMSITTAMTSVPKPAPDLIEAFRDAPTSVISDNLARLPGAIGLRPFHRGGRLVGTAFTVRTRPGDNLAIHRALELVGPGDVVDGGGDETRALVGEIMKTIAEYRGAAGYVIDGAIRDVAAFAASDFPCFARTAIHRGPYKSGPGEINVPVSIGGSVIAPGDIVVGDEDGVVSFPAATAAALLEAVRAQIAREEQTIISIREGRYQGSYGKS
jgi:regulator of RNase E activity RraA